MGLTKAKLEIEKEVGMSIIEVLFNPSEYQLTDGASYSEKKIPGLDGPILQYISGDATELSLNLFLDTYVPPAASSLISFGTPKQSTDVSNITKQIADATSIDGSMHRPPKVTFRWGSLNFEGVVTKMNHTYTMFTESGMPVRAKVSLTFKSLISLKDTKRKSPFESPDRTKYRTLRQGMGLWDIANMEYGDPDMWKVIARENGILNPLEVRPGQVVKLPAL
ncbi:hypothetical protein GN277_21125 [Lachnospiraceae bacterium WCA-9-b2]|uniref:LysM domain-containing protein n=1 Tax=Sporofaciens musculi TaxID=2681861 RepID=A0A7X3MJU0_9FIRM|nr:hypothetical protein [Sporofaciens musculi]MXP77761.1 hypothetical protein [Sporofaciens musculi]